MDNKDMKLDEGPLKDASTEQSGHDDNEERQGFSIEYLLGVQRDQDQNLDEFQNQFYRLQVEETLYSSLDSNLEPPNDESTRLKLDISKSQSPDERGRIVFSPGGSEAFVYPSTNSQQEPSLIPSKPEGERPTTVGQALDENPPRALVGGQTLRPQPDVGLTREEFLQENTGQDFFLDKRSGLQGRMADMRTSLDAAASGADVPSSVVSSANPSPRRFRFSAGVRERFLLQDPDNYFNIHHSVSEHELTADAESAAETNSPLMTSRGGVITDRATSPSMASVTSGYSAASSVGAPGVRRNLEWDSGADLGYTGGLLAQKDVAASLSTLEKLAIGNYSNFFRAEPEGKSSRDRAVAASRKLPKPPAGQDRDEDMYQMRIHKFADSLLRQRSLHSSNVNPLTRVIPTSASGQASVQERTNAGQGRSKSDDSPQISPTRRRRRHKKPMERSRSNYKSPMRSSSLTDLSQFSRNTRWNSQTTNSDWFHRRSSPPQHFSEPSSSSSTATVVPLQTSGHEFEFANHLLQTISTDPRSLPLELQSMIKQDSAQLQPFVSLNLVGERSDRNVPGRLSQTSLNSRQSASRSFETVIRVLDSEDIETEDEIRQVRLSSKMKNEHPTLERPARKEKNGESRGPEKSTRASTVSKESVSKSDQGATWISQRSSDLEDNRSKTSRHAWTTSNDETDSGVRPELEPLTTGKDSTAERFRSGRRSTSALPSRHAGRSRPPQDDLVATTSEDDARAESRLRERRRPNFPAFSNTLDSVGHIDRAKSFEYFPGESFPIQENSSSYEYLPGHLVDDRPATVVSKHEHEVDRRPAHDLMRETSECLTTEDTTSSSDAGHPKDKKKVSNDAMGCDDALGQLSRQLLAKSKEIHSAHVAKSKDFHRRLKRYIAFISTPSLTAEDSRIKQEVAAQILALVQNEESKLTDFRRFSSNLVVSEATTRVKSRDVETPDKGIPANEKETVKVTGEDSPDGVGVSKHTQEQDQSKSSLSELSVELAMVTSIAPADNLTTDDVEVQKLRVEQMRKLRKELRKLEKLERLRLNKAVGGSPSVDAELLREMQDNSYDSISTNATDATDMSLKPPPPVSESRLIVEGRSTTSSSDTSQTKTRSTRVVGPLRSKSTQSTISKETTMSVSKATTSTSSKPKSKSSQSQSISKSLSLFTAKKVPSSDFGQTCPTPRSEKTTESLETSREVSGLVIGSPAGRELGDRKTAKRKPIAFYVPLSNQSPIIIGKRILREKNREDGLGKENRNILANYIAGLNADVDKMKKKPDQQNTPKPNPNAGLTLQESLVKNRPDFVHRARYRSQVLKQIKEHRLEHQERLRQWFANPSNVDKSPPTIATNFVAPRLFNYNRMVAESRRKYLGLPEVRTKQIEMRRRSDKRTNRVMASVFKQRLKNRVLRGQISLNHKDGVI